MSIDDKAIGHDGFTVLSNNDTGKMAMMVECTQAVDKFHVMKYVYDALGDVRKRIVKEWTEQLSKEKKRTPEDRKILYEIELYR